MIVSMCKSNLLLGGGVDVVVIMQSGVQYLVNMSKQQVLVKLER